MNYIDNVLLKLFISGEEAAGYEGIVNSLVEKGSCLTTEQAKGIDFGFSKHFISITPYPEGVGLVKISFDKEEAKKSKVFRQHIEEHMQKMRATMVELEMKQDALNTEYADLEDYLNLSKLGE